MSRIPCDTGSAETSAFRTPQPGEGGGAQKGGPVNSQYVVGYYLLNV